MNLDAKPIWVRWLVSHTLHLGWRIKLEKLIKCPIYVSNRFWISSRLVVFNPSDKYSSIWWSSTTFTAGFHQAFRKASWVPCFQNSNQGLPLSQLQTANFLSKSTETFPRKMSEKNVRSLIFGCCWHCITSQSRPPSTLWWAHCEKDESLVAAWWHPYVWKWKASSSTWETLEATVEGHTQGAQAWQANHSHKLSTEESLAPHLKAWSQQNHWYRHLRQEGRIISSKRYTMKYTCICIIYIYILYEWSCSW